MQNKEDYIQQYKRLQIHNRINARAAIQQDTGTYRCYRFIHTLIYCPIHEFLTNYFFYQRRGWPAPPDNSTYNLASIGSITATRLKALENAKRINK